MELVCSHYTLAHYNQSRETILIFEKKNPKGVYVSRDYFRYILGDFIIFWTFQSYVILKF